MDVKYDGDKTKELTYGTIVEGTIVIKSWCNDWASACMKYFFITMGQNIFTTAYYHIVKCYPGCQDLSNAAVVSIEIEKIQSDTCDQKIHGLVPTKHLQLLPLEVNLGEYIITCMTTTIIDLNM